MDNAIFKKEILLFLNNNKYVIECKSFEKGDFGDLDVIEIRGQGFIGDIGFWSKGFLEASLINVESGKDLLNIFIYPDDSTSKNTLLKELKDFLVL